MLGIVITVTGATILLLLLFIWLIGERGRLVQPSTWRFIREGGVRRLLNFSDLHAYIYGRWTKQYLNVLINYVFPRLKRPRMKKWLADRYHGKVISLAEARSIIAINKDIPLRDLEQIIPYPVARDLVLEGPPDIVAYECFCRHARQNPCQPTQVCMVIGKTFTDFVLEHHPERSRKLSKDEALELLQAEHERGHLHSAWFKDAFLDRFFAICNCCKCCCGGIEAMTKYGIPMMASSGHVAQVDSNLCATCGACVDVCAFGALSIDGARLAIDWEKCMGCGLCAGKCPKSAISLQRDERKGSPFDVRLFA